MASRNNRKNNLWALLIALITVAGTIVAAIISKPNEKSADERLENKLNIATDTSSQRVNTKRDKNEETFSNSDCQNFHYALKQTSTNFETLKGEKISTKENVELFKSNLQFQNAKTKVYHEADETYNVLLIEFYDGINAQTAKKIFKEYLYKIQTCIADLDYEEKGNVEFNESNLKNYYYVEYYTNDFRIEYSYLFEDEKYNVSVDIVKNLKNDM